MLKMNRRGDFDDPPMKFAKLEEENVKLLEIGLRLYELNASEFPRFQPNDNPSSDDILRNVMKFCAYFKKKMGSSTNDTIFANITDLIVLMTGIERRVVIEKMTDFQLLDWVTNYEPGRMEDSVRYQNLQHFQQQNQQIEMPSGSPVDSPNPSNFEPTSSSSCEEIQLQQPSSSASSSMSRVFVAQIVKKPIQQAPQRVETVKPSRCVMKQAHHIINKLILQYPYAIFTWESFLMDIPSNMSSFPTKLVNTAFSQLKEQKLIYQCDSRKAGQQLYIIKEMRVNCLNPLYLYGYSVEDYIGNMITHCKQPLLDQLRNFDHVFPQPENGTNYFPVLMNTFSLAILQYPSLHVDLSTLEMVKADMAVRALALLESHNIITIMHENGVRVQKLTDVSQIEPYLRFYGLTKELFMKMLRKSIESTGVGGQYDEFQTEAASYSPLQYFPLMAEDRIKTEMLDFVVKQEDERL